MQCTINVLSNRSLSAARRVQEMDDATYYVSHVVCYFLIWVRKPGTYMIQLIIISFSSAHRHYYTTIATNNLTTI